MGSPVLKCEHCGSNKSRKLIAVELVGLRCEKCYTRHVDTGSARLHKYSNPYHKGLSEAKERVFERSYVDKDSGDVFDNLTKKEAAY